MIDVQTRMSMKIDSVSAGVIGGALISPELVNRIHKHFGFQDLSVWINQLFQLEIHCVQVIFRFDNKVFLHFIDDLWYDRNLGYSQSKLTGRANRVEKHDCRFHRRSSRTQGYLKIQFLMTVLNYKLQLRFAGDRRSKQYRSVRDTRRASSARLQCNDRLFEW